MMADALPTVPAGEPQTEPWMRSTHTELDPLRRGVIHALELVEEDVARWTSALSDAEIFAIPQSLPSVAFHMRHIVRSLDRLLTYAEARSLTETQLAALHAEHDAGTALAVREEFTNGIRDAKARVRNIDPATYYAARGIGRRQLPSTVGGLLVHCADHSQRHSGQMVTTAKIIGAHHL